VTFAPGAVEGDVILDGVRADVSASALAGSSSAIAIVSAGASATTMRVVEVGAAQMAPRTPQALKATG